MLINGTPGSTLSALDRGIQYGDGLFETIAVVDGRLCQWQRHIRRLQRGCEVLNIEFPDEEQLLAEAGREINGGSRLVLKIILTRGSGGRGYRPPTEQTPTRLVYSTEWPEYPDHFAQLGIRARICNMRLSRNTTLAGLKTLNRLEQVLARAEWDDPEIAEGLMLDDEGFVIEGTMSNLFLIRDERIITPDLGRCGVAGIMRELVIEQAADLGLRLSCQAVSKRELMSADAIFLCNSLIGIWPVCELEGERYETGAIPPSLVDSVMRHGYCFE